MNCPQCGQRNPAGSETCSNCGTVLEAQVAELSAEATRITAREGATRITAAAGASSVPAAPATTDAPRRRAALLPEVKKPDVGSEAQKAADDLAAYYRSLKPADRFVAAMGVTLLFLLCLPWVTTRAEGTLIGFFAGAWPAAVLSAAVLALMYWRVSSASPENEQLLAWGQLACAAVAALFCALFLKGAYSAVLVHAGAKSAATLKSAPEPWAFAGAACALAMLGGSVRGALARR